MEKIVLISLVYGAPLAAYGVYQLGIDIRNRVMSKKGYIKVMEEMPNKKTRGFYVRPEGKQFEYKGKLYKYNPNFEYHINHRGIMTTFYDKTRRQILFNTDPDRADGLFKVDTAAFLGFINAVKKLSKNERLKEILLYVAAGGAAIAVIVSLMVLGKIDELAKVVQNTQVVIG